MNGSMVAVQIVGLLVMLGVPALYLLRARAKAKEQGSYQPSLDALEQGFLQTRLSGESTPVCVVAFHRTAMKLKPVVVGVTSHRVLVAKGVDFLAFPYDDEGEHLPAAQKTQQGRGFFDCSHDDSEGYCPTVKQAPFTGQVWWMYPALAGFPQQKANLREFSRRFYFQWFYD